MKIKNQIENSLIAIIVLLVGLLAFNELKFKPMRSQFEKQIKMQAILIEELSKVEKYKIENTFDKVKAKDGTIDLTLSNQMLNSSDSAISVEGEKGGGLFNFFKSLRDD